MRLQVDWLTAEVAPTFLPQARLFDTGTVAAMAPGGVVEWMKAKLLAVEGSHDTRLMVVSRDGVSATLTGNPVKFFQGHNLFGSDDAVGLFFAAGLAVREQVGNFPGPSTWGAYEFSGPKFSRIDITRSYRFPTQAQARAWLRDVASTARTRHGAAMCKEGTVYYGKQSRRWSWKVYSKADEISASGRMHRIARSVLGADKSALEDWAQGVVRFELTLRGMELAEHGFAEGRTLTPACLAVLWQRYFERVTFNRNGEDCDMADRATASPQALGYLARWRLGEDLRVTMNERVFRRWRSRILQEHGIDIAVKPLPSGERSQVGAELDPAGWDPEPLQGAAYTPDPQLTLAYTRGTL